MLFARKPRVQAYTVHESPTAPSDRGDRAEALIFIRDGFSITAFVAAPVWMLAKQLWLPFIGYILSVTLLIAVLAATGVDNRWLLYGLLAFHLLIGFEADSLERWALDRKGWRLISSVSGATFEDCERRFFENWLPAVPAVATGNLRPPGTPGGLSYTTGAAPPPYRGEVIPPRRTTWKSSFSWRK